MLFSGGNMKRLIIIMIVILVAVAGVAITTRSLKSQQLKLGIDEIPPNKNRLKWYVAKAKNQGVEDVQINAPMVEYLGLGSRNLNEAISGYSLVVAKPILSQTIIDETDSVVTWYKFEIVEFVSKTDKPACMTCPLPSPPNEMFPVSENEFVAGKYGGIVEVDGIKIKAIDNHFPDFKTGKEYLLFISRYDNGAATIGMGPSSIFTVENDGSLQKFNDTPNVVKEEIEREHGKSLLNVRTWTKQIRDSKKIQ
jgi:hypothetical protein